MGVIYQPANDIDELLLPLIAAKSPGTTVQSIRDRYRLAATGLISADEFWLGFGIDPGIEREFLNGYGVDSTVKDFLRACRTHFDQILIFSNDIARWSTRRGDISNIADLVDGVLVSSAMKARKPDLAAFAFLKAKADCQYEQISFIDDRSRNLDAAKGLGISTYYLAGSLIGEAGGHIELQSLRDILR